MSSATNKRIKATVDFWSRKSGRFISEEDAREINANLSGFFAVLREWDQKQRCSVAYDDSIAGVSQANGDNNG